MPKAEMTDFHEALGQNVLQEPADTLDDVKSGGSRSSTSRFAVGDGDGTVVESHETPGGDGDPKDIRGEVWEGCIAIGTGLRVDIPRDIPEVWIEVIQ
jgi:hypothetical protein